MRSIYFTCTLTMVFLLINSCKKETTTIKEEYNPNIPIYGTWKTTGIPHQDFKEVKYLNFSNKKNCTVYSSNTLGFRSSVVSSFVPYPDQIIVDFYGYSQSSVYNYRRSGDSLIIELGNLVILKTVKTPESDVNGWADEISQTDKIFGLYIGRGWGIGFDGTNLLIPDYSNNEVSKINLSTRLPNGVISVTGSYPTTVEFDGTDIWVSSNGFSKINRYALAGGSVLSSSPDLGAWIYGIAFDPSLNHLWANSGNEDTMYQFNKNTNAMISTRYIGSGFRDLAWSNGKLFIVRNAYIYRVNTSGFIIEKTYKLKTGQSIYGIVSVGSDFWLNVEGDKLIKVTLN